MPGNWSRDLKPQKLNNEISSLFQTPHGRGKDDAEVGIQRLRGTSFALVLSSLQLKDAGGSFEGGEARGNAES